MNPTDPAWLSRVEAAVDTFASKNRLTLRKTKANLAASFEIGCFHLLLNFYTREKFDVTLNNIIDNGYKYLTTPAGNPANFSYVTLRRKGITFQIRQQVRIRSHLSAKIAFTPDLVVLRVDTSINSSRTKKYASGKRRFFFVDSSDVIAAHECKSTNPFPELLVSFIGTLLVAHEWYVPGNARMRRARAGHLAPCLFIGGTSRAFYIDMIKELERVYPINIAVGIHDKKLTLIRPVVSKKNRGRSKKRLAPLRLIPWKPTRSS